MNAFPLYQNLKEMQATLFYALNELVTAERYF
jgi:hypothetical protein